MSWISTSRAATVYGWDAPPPRLTPAALLLGAAIIAPPSALLIWAMDAAVGALIHAAFGVCVTVACLL